jgi:hypothetical protein
MASGCCIPSSDDVERPGRILGPVTTTTSASLPAWTRRVPKEWVRDEAFWQLVNGAACFFRRFLLFFPLATLSAPFYALGWLVVANALFLGALLGVGVWALSALRAVPPFRQTLEYRARIATFVAIISAVVRPIPPGVTGAE